MFCAKCGAEIKPTDAFCLKCGAENKLRQATPAQPIQNPAPTAPRPTQYTAPAAPNPVNRSMPAAPSYPNMAPVPGNTPAPAAPAEKKDKKKLFIILGAAALALILMITLFARCFGPKAVVRRAMNGLIHQNAKKIIRTLPEEIVDEWELDSDYFEDEFEEMEEEYEDDYGENYRISFEILGTQKIDGKEFRNLKDHLEDFYRMDSDRITAAKTVFVLIKIKGSEGRNFRVWSYSVVKYQGKWYMTNTP